MANNVKFMNVLVLGLSFTLIFTAFLTTANVQTDVLNQVVRDGNHPLQGKGYTSAAIIYAVFSVFNFLGPPIVHALGPRLSMVISSVTYCIFIGNLVYPLVFTLYIASAIIGIGAAVLWTAQGNFLTINSNDETMGRNSGIFWAFFQLSLLPGNIFVYFYFKGKVIIDEPTRINLFVVLLVCCAVGSLLLLALRNPSLGKHAEAKTLQGIETVDKGNASANESSLMRKEYGTGPKLTPLQAFYRSFQLLQKPKMQLLCLTMAYTGFCSAFFTGVYGTSVANTKGLSDRKRQLGLVGVFIGVGDIIGALAFGVLGKRTIRTGRDPIILFAFILHTITFYLVYLNLPDRSPIEETEGPSHLNYNVVVVGLCSFLYGLGDSGFNTQLFSSLGTLFPDDGAPAFAMFKFVQSVATSIGFGYSIATPLAWQLFVLCIFGSAGTLSFFAVEQKWKLAGKDSVENLKRENRMICDQSRIDKPGEREHSL